MAVTHCSTCMKDLDVQNNAKSRVLDFLGFVWGMVRDDLRAMWKGNKHYDDWYGGSFIHD